MRDLIYRQAAIDAFKPYIEYESNRTHAEWVRRITLVLEALPSIDAVQVVRCKDCKHRPEKVEESDEYDMDTDLEFPDEVCPCQCDDYYYSWMPKDDWFCPKGERKEE